MLQLPQPLVLHLQDGELLPVDGVRLRVEAGRVWVTRRNDLDDHFLDSGSTIDLARGSGALVSAEGAARVRLSAAKPRAQPFQVNGNATWRQKPLGT